MIDWVVLVPVVCGGLVSVIGAVGGLIKVNSTQNQQHLEKILGPARDVTLREDFDQVLERIGNLEKRQAKDDAALPTHAKQIKKNTASIENHSLQIEALQEAAI